MFVWNEELVYKSLTPESAGLLLLLITVVLMSLSPLEKQQMEGLGHLLSGKTVLLLMADRAALLALTAAPVPASGHTKKPGVSDSLVGVHGRLGAFAMPCSSISNSFSEACQWGWYTTASVVKELKRDCLADDALCAFKITLISQTLSADRKHSRLGLSLCLSTGGGGGWKCFQRAKFSCVGLGV